MRFLALEINLLPLSIWAQATASVLALAAAVVDLKTHRIPNALVIAIAVLGLGFAAEINGLGGALKAVAGFAVGFCLLTPGFVLGFTGGGDLKLFAAFGCFLGPQLTFAAVLVYYPIAAVMVLGFMIATLARRHWLAKAGRESDRGRGSEPTASDRINRRGACRESFLKSRLPMAPAIACAVVTTPLFFG